MHDRTYPDKALLASEWQELGKAYASDVYARSVQGTCAVLEHQAIPQTDMLSGCSSPAGQKLISLERSF